MSNNQFEYTNATLQLTTVCCTRYNTICNKFAFKLYSKYSVVNYLLTVMANLMCMCVYVCVFVRVYLYLRNSPITNT